VISHAPWHKLFAGRDAVGASPHVNGKPFTIIGVAAPEFRTIAVDDPPADVWLPFRTRHTVLGRSVSDVVRTPGFLHPQGYVDVGIIDCALPEAEFYRYLRTIVEAGFGDRVMFGTDQMVWPETIERAIARLTPGIRPEHGWLAHRGDEGGVATVFRVRPPLRHAKGRVGGVRPDERGATRRERQRIRPRRPCRAAGAGASSIRVTGSRPAPSC
jgi:hypothetical protein